MRTKFYGVTSYTDPYLSQQLESNLCYYFAWGFLEAGAYQNVNIPTSGIYGGNWHRLSPAKDDGYTDGQVWQAARKNFVWETGVSRDTQPIRVSGVFIGGAFQPVTGVGTYAHTVDYWNGRVIFDSAISTSSEVTCEYSYRYVNIYDADSLGDFQKALQFGSLRVDDEQFLQFGSGSWDRHPRKRIQLPAVVVEAQPETDRLPNMLGTLQSDTGQQLIAHVFAANDFDYKQVHDILTYQKGTTINLFNKKTVLENQRFGLNFDGSANASGSSYPVLATEFGWKECRIEEAKGRGFRYGDFPLIYCPIFMTCRVNIP